VVEHGMVRSVKMLEHHPKFLPRRDSSLRDKMILDKWYDLGLLPVHLASIAKLETDSQYQ
jgi:hypothetical protein